MTATVSQINPAALYQLGYGLGRSAARLASGDLDKATSALEQREL